MIKKINDNEIKNASGGYIKEHSILGIKYYGYTDKKDNIRKHSRDKNKAYIRDINSEFFSTIGGDVDIYNGKIGSSDRTHIKVDRDIYNKLK